MVVSIIQTFHHSLYSAALSFCRLLVYIFVSSCQQNPNIHFVIGFIIIYLFLAPYHLFFVMTIGSLTSIFSYSFC